MAQHLSPTRIREIYDVVFALVAEHGYPNVRIDQIAKAAHTSTATIYRHWGSKSKLVVGVLTAEKPDDHHCADTGSLIGDLHALIADAGDTIPAALRFLTSIALATKDDPELAETYYTHGVPVITSQLDSVVQRAIDRGELRANHPAVRRLVPLLLTPFAVEGLLLGHAVTDSDIHNYIDDVVAPLLGVDAPPQKAPR